MSTNIIDKHLPAIINDNLLRKVISDSTKIASLRPILKKGERNYRLDIILNCFSKIYERYLHDQTTSFSNKFLSDFISACRKVYFINNVLIRLIENWKTKLDRNILTGAV